MQLFDLLPGGTVSSLLLPENKARLAGILTYHVVAGKLSAADIAKLINNGNGTATLTTIAGGKLGLSMEGKLLAVKDEKGGTAYLTIKDVDQRNGVIHVIDHVLLPQ